MGLLDIFKTKRKVKKPRNELKEKINNAIGLATRFAQRVNRRDLNKMNNYLSEAEKLSNSLDKGQQEQINKRIKEIRIIGYKGEIKRVLDEADKEIDSGSIRIEAVPQYFLYNHKNKKSGKHFSKHCIIFPN